MHEVLAPHLGPHMAAKAVDLVAAKIRRDVASLSFADLEAASDAVAPMLRTLLGRRRTDRVLDDLHRKSRPGVPSEISGTTSVGSLGGSV